MKKIWAEKQKISWKRLNAQKSSFLRGNIVIWNVKKDTKFVNSSEKRGFDLAEVKTQDFTKQFPTDQSEQNAA